MRVYKYVLIRIATSYSWLCHISLWLLRRPLVLKQTLSVGPCVLESQNSECESSVYITTSRRDTEPGIRVTNRELSVAATAGAATVGVPPGTGLKMTGEF